MISRLLFLTLLCALPVHAASGYYKDSLGDLKIDGANLKCMDISSVKVTSTDKKIFVFEVKTKEPIKVTEDNPPYFLVAANLDGDTATGNTAWIYGQDLASFIYLKESSVKDVNTYYGDKNVMTNVSIEGNTLRFTLKFDASKQKRMTFNIRSMIRRQSEDGRVPYTVLDSSVPSGEQWNELKL